MKRIVLRGEISLDQIAGEFDCVTATPEALLAAAMGRLCVNNIEPPAN